MSVLPAPYFEAHGITLYLGSCLDILPHLTADAIITDPPYNVGKKYGKHTDDRRPWDEWCAWWDTVLGLCLAAAPDVFSFFSQVTYRKYLRFGQLEPNWTGVWSKPLAMAACASAFMPHWEPIAYWGTTTRAKGGFWGNDVFECNVEVGKTRHGHPTPKPLKLMRQMMTRLTKPDALIGDPFAGSGTTLQAAYIEGRRAWGIEVEEPYAETIARRIERGEMGATAPRQGMLPFTLAAGGDG